MRILPLVLLLALAGCSSTQKKSEVPAPAPKAGAQEKTWRSRQAQLAAAPNWQAEGRMAATRGEKGGNASFVWQQRGEGYKIKLYGPFGSGAVHITGNSKYAEVQESSGKITKAKSPEALLHKIAGWQVPIEGLRYWLRGMPSPDNKNFIQKMDAQGQLTYLQQDGWQVRYEDYTAQGSLPLPSKLHLQNNDVRVKMIINNWKRI